MLKHEELILSNFSLWEEFLSLLPGNWKEIAQQTDLLKGLRKDKDPNDFLRTLMLHLLCGYSLRETATAAAALGIAGITDVAMLKRLRKSKDFLKALCQRMMGTTQADAGAEGFRFRLIDGTDIKEPGQFGTHWRVHFSFILSQMECDELKLTQTKGEGTGEDLRQFTVKKGDILVADRGYSRSGGFLHVIENGGYFIVRLNTQALRLRGDDGSPLDLAALLRKLQRPLECLEARVLSNDAEGKPTVPLRLCAIKKEAAAAAQAEEGIRRTAVRRGEAPLELTRLASGYVIVVTNLPSDAFPLKSVLESYRLRWQVELAFKRMKSLLKVGALPKHTDASSKAWLYGKLLIALLLEKCSSHLGAFSPWGGCKKEESIRKPMVQLQFLVENGEGLGATHPFATLPEEELELD